MRRKPNRYVVAKNRRSHSGNYVVYDMQKGLIMDYFEDYKSASSYARKNRHDVDLATSELLPIASLASQLKISRQYLNTLKEKFPVVPTPNAKCERIIV